LQTAQIQLISEPNALAKTDKKAILAEKRRAKREAIQVQVCTTTAN